MLVLAIELSKNIARSETIVEGKQQGPVSERPSRLLYLQNEIEDRSDYPTIKRLGLQPIIEKAHELVINQKTKSPCIG